MLPRSCAALVAAVALLLGALGAVPTGAQAAPRAVHGADRDCADFATQAAAQRFYVDHGGPRSDPHRLDEDDDGVACESNPCPCSTSTSGGDQGGQGGATRPPREVDRAVVVRVVDGDTLDVRLGKGKRRVRVRVLGIDTPEVYGGRECWGTRASRSGRRILPKGTRVVLASDRTQALEDRYGRLLRYVTKTSNRADFGRVQLRRGSARVYVYGKPVSRSASYQRAQAEAKRAGRGLWGGC